MYKPLPDCLTISKSKIAGLGLFATKTIPKETNLGITHISDISFEDSYIRTPLGGFFNHSVTPNCKIVETNFGKFLSLKTIKTILSGEELTAFYTLYDPTCKSE